MNPYYQDAAAAKFQRYDWRSRTDHRDALVAKYAWAIPNDNAIELLAGMGPIIEMGAGNGYWAKLIVDAGGKIEPYDVKPGQHHCHAVPRTVWYPVIEGGPEAITVRHKDWVLLLVWPPYESSLAFDALMDVDPEFAKSIAGGMDDPTHAPGRICEMLAAWRTHLTGR